MWEVVYKDCNFEARNQYWSKRQIVGSRICFIEPYYERDLIRKYAHQNQHSHALAQKKQSMEAYQWCAACWPRYNLSAIPYRDSISCKVPQPRESTVQIHKKGRCAEAWAQYPAQDHNSLQQSFQCERTSTKRRLSKLWNANLVSRKIRRNDNHMIILIF